MFMKAISRRRSLAGAALVLLSTSVLTPAFAQETAKSDVLELKVAVADANVNPVTDSVLKLADTLGYYKNHGVHVTIVALEGTPQAVAALNSGAVDLADIGIDAALRLRADNDVAIRGVVSATLGPPYLIVAKSDIAKADNLVGRTFAIADNGSLDHNLTQQVLASMGVARDGPRYVTIGAPAARVQALAAGQVDATTVSYGSFLPISNTPGLAVIVSPEDFFKAAPIQSKFLAGLEPTLKDKHEAIQRFVDALVDISRHYDGDAPDWVKAMTKARDDLSEANLTATSKFLVDRWCVNGCLNVDYIQKTADFIYAGPDFKDVRVIPASDVTDESFVKGAIADVGAYKDGGIDARP
ncbi:MAG TPA: ABC transporter substrate-binding protein [Devosiaceae bacterium]|jgi:NitT/TauT family transport system substrate-binding protein